MEIDCSLYIMFTVLFVNWNYVETVLYAMCYPSAEVIIYLKLYIFTDPLSYGINMKNSTWISTLYEARVTYVILNKR